MDENNIDEQTINDFQEYLQKKNFDSKNEEQQNNNDDNNVEEEKNEQEEKNDEKEEESEEGDFESYDESESDMSSYEDDEDDENDKALMDLLLKQILACHKKKPQRLRQKIKFRDILENILNLNMETRAKKINEKHIHNFIFLTNAILKKEKN